MTQKTCCVCLGGLYKESPRAKYCSQRCRDWLRRHPGELYPTERQCKHCYADISHTKLDVRFCSLLCQRRGLNGTPQAPNTRYCKECGVVFAVKHAAQVYCVVSCRNTAGTRRWKENNPEKYALSVERSTPAVRAGNHRWRARRRGTAVGYFTNEAVFERDAWVCGICKGNVMEKLKWPHPLSPSLDHVIPLARNGTHTWGNVQLAHLVCNLKKGAKYYALAP